MKFHFFKSRLNHPRKRLDVYSATALGCVAYIAGMFIAGLLGKYLA